MNQPSPITMQSCSPSIMLYNLNKTHVNKANRPISDHLKLGTNLSVRSQICQLSVPFLCMTGRSRA